MKVRKKSNFFLFLLLVLCEKGLRLSCTLGKTKEGEDVSGTITIPEVAHDTEEDEYVVCSLYIPLAFVLLRFMKMRFWFDLFWCTCPMLTLFSMVTV